MTRYMIRLLLISAAFFFVFPMIPGIQFHGNFAHALVVGMLFAFIGWIVESFAIAISALLTLGTLGMALVILIPAWILGFWLLPALALMYVAQLVPGSLSFAGWQPAMWGGLIMLGIGIVTSGNLRERAQKTTRDVTAATAHQ